MSTAVKAGDMVTLTHAERQWRVVYVDEERGFARLEFAGEAWVRSRVVGLADLHRSPLQPVGPRNVV